MDFIYEIRLLKKNIEQFEKKIEKFEKKLNSVIVKVNKMNHISSYSSSNSEDEIKYPDDSDYDYQR